MNPHSRDVRVLRNKTGDAKCKPKGYNFTFAKEKKILLFIDWDVG